MRDLRWVAQYADGRIVREHEFQGSWARGRWVEHPFLGLDLSQVISFGFEGSGLRVGFATTDGIIGINGKALELRFVLTNERIFLLTGRQDTHYRTILQWKEAHHGLGMSGITWQDGKPVRARLEARGGIDAYVLGWEIGGFDDDLGGWESTLTVTIPTDDAEALRALLTMVAQRGLQAQFEFFIAGHRVVRVPTLLRPGVRNQITLNLHGAGER